MRKHRWAAAHAVRHLLGLRSSVSPNEGFWRQLCAFEATLAIPSSQRSNVQAPPAMTETFGELSNIRVGADAAGDRALVDIRPAGVEDSPTRGTEASVCFALMVLTGCAAFTLRGYDASMPLVLFATMRNGSGLSAGKRGYDANGNDAEDLDATDAKRQRASGGDRDGGGGGRRVELQMDVTRDGAALGDLNLELKPLQVRLQVIQVVACSCCQLCSPVHFGGTSCSSCRSDIITMHMFGCRFVRLEGMQRRMSNCSMLHCPGSMHRFRLV